MTHLPITAVTALALLATNPALADQRNYSVTSFNRIRIEGPVTVVVETGGSPSARADGDRMAIDMLRVEMRDNQLLIGLDRSNWMGSSSTGSKGRAVLHIGTPTLEALSVIGAGDVTVDRVRGVRFGLVLAGAGKAVVGALDVDRLTVGINGAGDATLAGNARDGELRSQGNATIDAAGLMIDDVDISLIGTGAIHLTAKRSAHAILKGSGQIIIDGTPACTGSSEGSGEVLCGGREQ